MSAVTPSVADRWLELGSLLRELVAGGRLSQDDAEQCLTQRHAGNGQPQHPLELIAARQLADLARPGHILDLETLTQWLDRKSTRLNSSHVRISYAVFCLKKKNIIKTDMITH